ncbi:MAG: hypothetical protein U0Q11_11615 [Vicinamibacterales bacterium]
MPIEDGRTALTTPNIDAIVGDLLGHVIIDWLIDVHCAHEIATCDHADLAPAHGKYLAARWISSPIDIDGRRLIPVDTEDHDILLTRPFELARQQRMCE